ncbi:YscO family type III secretion system apparatus protein [Roseibium sp.]|uniref:type III secretion system stalk subunit SctO n=1 Tax=Roseibium sp. TaxID=1936156 RepID=UPI003267B200
MIEKFRILQKVKATREDTALRALRAKREQLSEAVRSRRQQEKAVEDSAAALPDREAAVYQEIMRKVVDAQKIDATKEKVVQLHKDHEHLEDDLEMAIQRCLRLTQEVDDAHRAYQVAQRTREKFDMMLEDLVREHADQAERAEEAEIEELFAKGRPVPA